MRPVIVVTGMGMLHQLGLGYKTCWGKLCEGVKPEVTTPGIIQMDGFDADDTIEHEQTRRMDRVSQMLAVVVDQLLKDAQASNVKDYEQTGICVSTQLGTLDTVIHFSERIYKQEPNRANPLEFPNTVQNASSGHTSIVYGLKGHSNTVAGFGSMGEAFDVLQLQRAQAMLATGIDEAGHYQQQAVTKYAETNPKPFSQPSEGIWLGEGAAGLFLETRQSVEDRGATVYARYLGYQAGFDADRSATVSVLEKSIRKLLEMSEKTPEAIDGIVLAGGGTEHSDALIRDALKVTFGNCSSKLACFSVAGILGSMQGAEECVGAVCAVTALATSCWPEQAWLTEAVDIGISHDRVIHASPFTGKVVLVIAVDPVGVHYVHLFEKDV